jgi:hypothetical protein
MTTSKDMFIEERELELIPREVLTKTAIKSRAAKFVENVLEIGNPLEAAQFIKTMEEMIAGVKADKKFIDYVREEVTKHGKIYETPNGAKIENFEAGTKYCYDKCGDVILIELLQKQAKLDEEVKKRQDFLKTVPDDGIDIRVEDELVRVYPPSKTSTSTYKITLAK